jgi:hypothetical protein
LTKLQTQEADVLITPDFSSFNLFDTNQLADLKEKSYSEVNTILQKIVKRIKKRITKTFSGCKANVFNELPTVH